MLVFYLDRECLGTVLVHFVVRAGSRVVPEVMEQAELLIQLNG